MTMATNEYQVTGMSCGHWEASVRGEVSKLSGVEQVDVSAASGRLVITAATPPSLAVPLVVDRGAGSAAV